RGSRDVRLIAIVLAFVAAAATVHAQSKNSWIDATGKWETPANWSLATAPALNQGFVFVTNAGNKTVTIDATTSGSFSNSMTISNLFLSAPSGTINTQALTNAGLVRPLRLVNDLTIRAGGAMRITNSILRVDGLSGGGFTNDGTVTLLSGSIVTTNVGAFVGTSAAGQMSVSNGTWLAQTVIVGLDSGSQGALRVAGGTVTLSTELFVALNAGSRVVVTVTGGTRQVSGSLTVGDHLGPTG